jgi:hypothetical protein
MPEDDIFIFITQLISEHKVKQGDVIISLIKAKLQQHFLVTEEEANAIWLKYEMQSNEYTLQHPENGEFIESNNSGIDIAIYSQHPYYYFNIDNITSLQSYYRIYLL